MAATRTVFALLLVVVLVGLGGSVQPETDAATRPIALGVAAPGVPNDPAAIDALVRRIGRTPAVLAWYQAWGDHPNWAAFQLSLLHEVARRGAAPLISWEPWDPAAGNQDQPKYRLDNVLRGNFDVYIDSWARGIARFRGLVYLRFAPEMNGNWRPWSAGVNGNTAADYVAAWRYVHRRFRLAGVVNVRWVWNPNVTDGPTRPNGPYTPVAQLYPGDTYVNWLALDGYNWGGTRWRSFVDTFGPSYTALLRLTTKPMMIAETASHEAVGNKAAWIRDAFLKQLRDRFPQVRAVVWFDVNKERDWHVNSSAEALRAFSDSIRAPHFQGKLP